MSRVSSKSNSSVVTNESAPLVLRPKKSATILILLISLLFVAVGLGMGVSGDWIGYFCAAFFALGIPVFTCRLLPDKFYLLIGSDGFTVCNFRQKYFVPWSVVDKFVVININPIGTSKLKRVGYNLSGLYGTSSLDLEMSKSFAPTEAALPDTYGKKAEALAELMNAHLLKARAQNNVAPLTEILPSREPEIIVTRQERLGAGSGQIREIKIGSQSLALRLLRPADYALVVLCSFLLIGTLAGLGGGAGILDVIVIGFLSFCVYTGWRHVGVIDSRVWKAYIIVFPLLLLYCTAVIILNGTTEAGREEGEPLERLLITLTLLWLAWVAVSGLVSLVLLNTIRISGINLRLPKMLAVLRERRNSQGLNTKTLKRVDKRKGIQLCVFGIVIILIAILMPLPNQTQQVGRALEFYRFLSLLGFLLLIFAQRYLQVSIESLLASDQRRPILFLRSFDDDEKLQFKKADDSLLDFSLETRLSKHFRHFGPFIAIGSPTERVPQLGAARATLPDSVWQSKVMEWIVQSGLIVMYSGKTHWVNWELTKVIEAGKAPNLILIVPELKGSRRKRYEDSALRLERVRQALKDTLWSRSLTSLQVSQNIRALAFHEDGSITVIRSSLRNRDSYHLALLVAHYLTLNKTMT